jgi:hypothetical protein
MWWNIQQNNGGRFEMWADRGPHITAKTVQELEQQLSPNGVTGELYQNVLLQLARSGKARVNVSLGQFSQM